MKQYLDVMQHILDHGTVKSDRTGTGTLSLFGTHLRFNLADGFPLVTTKKMATKVMIAELLWFIKGSTNERELAEIQHGDVASNIIGKRTIWTANADKQGVDLGYTNTPTSKELGPVYGKQWREIDKGVHKFGQRLHNNIDQLADVIEQIKNNPDSRRHMVVSWNVAEIDDMALPPCHYAFQFYVVDGKLSCMFQMRSIDLFLGAPFNIASYALLTMMIAQVCDLELGDLVFSGGDTHIYSNHIEQCKLQLTREPLPLPTMILDPYIKSIDDFTMDSFTLVDYECHPAIKAEMAV